MAIHQIVENGIDFFCSRMGFTYVLRHWQVDLPLVYPVCWDVCTTDKELKVPGCLDESEFVRANAMAMSNFYL